MTSVGDRVSVVMGSDGKYYCKSSPSISVGDRVQAFIGSDGKWYASKSGTPSVGSRVLASLDSTGKWIAHISKDNYSFMRYLGFGGDSNFIYTLWHYKLVGDPTDYGCVEKRDTTTLNIIQSWDKIIDPRIWDIYPIWTIDCAATHYSQGYISGNSNYLITVYGGKYYWFDSTSDGLDFYLEKDVVNTGVLTGEIVIIESGWTSEYDSGGFYVINIRTGDTTLVLLNNPSDWRSVPRFYGETEILTRIAFWYSWGAYDYRNQLYINGTYTLTTKEFDPVQPRNSNGGVFDPYCYNYGYTYKANDVGFSDVYPIEMGSDHCIGWRWDVNTNTRTQFGQSITYSEQIYEGSSTPIGYELLVDGFELPDLPQNTHIYISSTPNETKSVLLEGAYSDQFGHYEPTLVMQIYNNGVPLERTYYNYYTGYDIDITDLWGSGEGTRTLYIYHSGSCAGPVGNLYLIYYDHPDPVW